MGLTFDSFDDLPGVSIQVSGKRPLEPSANDKSSTRQPPAKRQRTTAGGKKVTPVPSNNAKPADTVSSVALFGKLKEAVIEDTNSLGGPRMATGTSTLSRLLAKSK